MTTILMPEFLPVAQIEAIAAKLRSKYDQHTPPIDPVVIARGEQIEVYEASFGDDSKVSGILRTVGARRVIYVNKSEHRVRKRYSIAHELGHAILHPRDGDFEDSDSDMTLLYRYVDEPSANDEEKRARRRRETQANMFAAELLMPRTMVEAAFEVTDDLSDLATIFGVSRAAIGFRIANLGL